MVAVFLHFLQSWVGGWAVAQRGIIQSCGGGAGKETWWGAPRWTCGSSLRCLLVLFLLLALEGIWMLWCCGDGWLKYCFVDFKIFQWLLLKISWKNSLRSNLRNFMLKCKFLGVSHISSCLATAVFFDTGNTLRFQFLPKHASPPAPFQLFYPPR